MMGTIIVTEKGNVFCVDVDNQYKRFFSVYRRQHDHAKHPCHQSIIKLNRTLTN